MSIYDLQLSKQDYLNQFYQTLLSLLNASEGSGTSGDISTPRLTLIGLTRVKIDEAMPQSESVQFNLPGTDKSNIIDLYLNAILDESGKHTLQLAPKHILIPTDAGAVATIFEEGSDVGFVYLPDDYLRLKSFKIAGWLKDATEPILPDSPMYKRQSTALKGGKAKPVVAISSRIKTNVAVAQVDSVTVQGSSGAAILSGPGNLNKELVFNTSETTTASDFVTAYAAAYAAKGIALTRDDATLIFTASVAGTAFSHPTLLTTSGDLTGDVVRETANVPAREGKKVLEYYSDPSKTHTLERFLYIANVGAEYVQADLHDALTWMCAAKLLQIWGQFSGNESYAQRAMQQFELSLKNLL